MDAVSAPETVKLGQAGSQVINDNEEWEGENGRHWAVIQVIQDTVINQLTAQDITNVAGLLGITLVAGTILYGKFSVIKLTSGVVVAYYSE